MGYKNLVKLVSHSYLNNSEMNDPYISFEDLKGYSEGLICLAGGEFGIITKNFKENIFLCDELIKLLSKIFEENFFLEIQRNNKNIDSILQNYLLNLSQKSRIPLVATNENFFLK